MLPTPIFASSLHATARRSSPDPTKMASRTGIPVIASQLRRCVA
jgi:hypothetical protein